MTDASRPFTPLRLARSVPRLLAVGGSRAVIGALGLATGLVTSGAIGVALTITGTVVLVYAAGVLLYLFTVRVEASPVAVRVRWALGSRTYTLARSPVTRIRNPKRRGHTLFARVGGLGVVAGPAQIEGEDLAGALSLGGTRSLVVVTTTEGRLALGVEDEAELLIALGAAYPRQRRGAGHSARPSG